LPIPAACRRASGSDAFDRDRTVFPGLDAGDRLRVRLVRTDVEQGCIDFTRDGGR